MIPMEAGIMAATALGSWWMKKQAQDAQNLAREREMQIQARNQETKLMDAAAKRGAPWVRKFAAVTIILCVFASPLLVAFFKEIPVSVMQEVPQKSLLFGLIKWGKGVDVITANGLVFPEWVRYSVCAIIGFLFGPGFAKVK